MARAFVPGAGAAMNAIPAAPLSEFWRHHEPARADSDSRIAAGLLTAALYALFALLAWWSLTNTAAPPATAEITASILRDVPKKRVIEPLPPFLAHLIRPHAELPALPVFTVATGAPPQAPAPLPASAAKTSPMPGGTSGNGPMGQAASGNGAGGNGGALAGCLDPVWMRAVTERVHQFFYYPQAALSSRTFGVVMVRFVVHRDGHLSTLEIGKSSGAEILDKAAYDIVHSAEPLPPIPDRMHVERIDGQLAINFGVRNFNGAPTIGHCD
jgi:TonB family protein